MSLSEHDLQVLAELEHDLGSPSVMTRLCLLAQAARGAWGGRLLPAVALAAGCGLLAAGIWAGAVAGEIMVLAGIAAVSYAAYAVAMTRPGPVAVSLTAARSATAGRGRRSRRAPAGSGPRARSGRPG